MSQCIITFFTSSLKPLKGFYLNVVWVFLGWILTKYVKIGMFFWNYLYGIMGNFVQFLPILKKSLFSETTDQKPFIYHDFLRDV